MREIKFRAWTGTRMIDNTEFCDDFMAWEGDQIRAIIPDYYDNSSKKKYIPLMQYTGLKDRNGKEIYEGDIVKIDGLNSKHDGTIFEIGFRMGSFEMQNKEDLPPLSFIYMAVQLKDRNKIERDYQTMNYIEVIGNIHQNPELI